MGVKVNFNPNTKIIEVTIPPTGSPPFIDLDVRIDIYSDGKEDWLADPILNKLLFPVTALGGDPLPGDRALGSTFFLEYGWKIRPYNANHTFSVVGNLYTRDGSDPFLNTIDPYTVKVISTVSNLIEQVITGAAGSCDSDAIASAVWEKNINGVVAGSFGEVMKSQAFGGQVHVSQNAGVSGTAYPIGTEKNPVNNIADAVTIGTAEGIAVMHIDEDITVLSTDNIDGFHLMGSHSTKSEIIVQAGASTDFSKFSDCVLNGTLDGWVEITDATIEDLIGLQAVVRRCMLSPGTFVLGGVRATHFLNCFSGVPGLGTPEIDCNGSGPTFALRNYSGGIKIVNKTGPESVTLDLDPGQAIIDGTVTAGTIAVRGVGVLFDNSAGSTIVNSDGLINPVVNAAATWNMTSGAPGSPTLTYGDIVENNAFNFNLLAALQISVDAVPQDVWDVDASTVVADSFGEIARRVAFNGVVYVDPNGTAGTTYPTGTLGQPVSNIADAVSIATAEDIPNLWLLDDITLLATDNVNGLNIEGQNASRSSVTVTAGAKTNQTQWKNIKLDGTMNGTAIIRESILENLSNFSGIAFNCLLNPGTVAIDPTPPQPVFFLSCYSGVPSTNPIIDLVNSGIHLIVRAFSGGFEIQNMNGTSIACIDFNSGALVLDSTVTGGSVIIRGTYGLTDNSAGATVTQDTNLDHIETKVDLVQLDVTDIVATTLTILKYHANRTLIDETAFTLTVFEDDRVTPLIVFDLKDETGTASITSIFERIPLGSP